jgi:hypothetical protein
MFQSVFVYFSSVLCGKSGTSPAFPARLYDEVRRGNGKIEDVSYFHTENNNQVIIKSTSVSDPNPDWIRIGSGFNKVNGSGSGSRRATVTHKKGKN